MSTLLTSAQRFAKANLFKPPHPPLPWSWLGTKYRIDQYLMREWRTLLNASGLNEHRYRSLLAEYPAFFLLGLSGRPYFAITELRLGANYVVDLVIADDNASNGMIYTLIELERPYDRAFKANGDKSARLSHAIDQVENWQRWMEDNRSEARRVFPCGVNKRLPIVRYMIIIGTRTNTESWIEKRNDLAVKMRLEIRTYDYLTDRLAKMGRFFQDKSMLISSEEEHFTARARNALANPFFCAFNDHEWRSLCRDLTNSPHFTEQNAWVFLQHRRYAPNLKAFQKFCETTRRKDYNAWLKTERWDFQPAWL